MHSLGHVLWEVLDWPDGIIVGNLIASGVWAPLALLGAYLMRHKLMRGFVRLHHKHKTAHEAELAAQDAAK